ncbi:MAG TPA: alpha/beta hydrolase fold domain-containing protein [Firmicutes bacterium]|nr:alpha/beta hydrolase fold domain-containing protein [Bacillota bacterium]
MKKVFTILWLLIFIFCLAACNNTGKSPSSLTADDTGHEENEMQDQTDTNILIAYDTGGETGDTVEDTAILLQETIGGRLFSIEEDTDDHFSSYEFVLLGFAGENNTLPEPVDSFLHDYDFGAKTIFPFVVGENNDSASILSVISALQPGALLGDNALLFSGIAEEHEQEIIQWGQKLPLSNEALKPANSDGNTVATASVTPQAQQVLYLWEEGNVPATTEYTVNNGGYSDDPDFRPYITSFPVPEGTPVKGAVLICPGGAFQFRSDQPEGIDVAEALSKLGYQSFVVDYRLRPYTQQEGALDLARAVRFVRAHAEEYGIDENDIAVMGFSAGGILSGEMLLNYDGQINGTALDPDYVPDALDEITADAAACGMIYSFYGRLSVGTTDVELLRSGNLPPTFYCYGTRDPFYNQFLANADAAEEAGVSVERLQLDDMPHGFGAQGDWIPTYSEWLESIFIDNV